MSESSKYATFLPLLIALGFVLRAWRKEKAASFDVPLQFWLLDLIALTLTMAVWLAVVPLSDEFAYEGGRRLVLCLCAGLAGLDILELFKIPVTAKSKALACVPALVLFAYTHGMGLLLWCLLRLMISLRAPISATGFRAVLMAGAVYLVAYALPFELAPKVLGNAYGFQAYMETAGSCIEYATGTRDNFFRFGEKEHVTAWLANPLLWIAWTYALRGQGLAAALTAGSATYFSIVFYGDDEVEWEWLPCYHTWIASMFLMTVLCFVFMLLEKRKSPSDAREQNVA